MLTDRWISSYSSSLYWLFKQFLEWLYLSVANLINSTVSDVGARFDSCRFFYSSFFLMMFFVCYSTFCWLHLLDSAERLEQFLLDVQTEVQKCMNTATVSTAILKFWDKGGLTATERREVVIQTKLLSQRPTILTLNLHMTHTSLLQVMFPERLHCLHSQLSLYWLSIKGQIQYGQPFEWHSSST